MDMFYNRINDYGSVSIRLASPEDIRRWSFGEIKKPETINYRTYRSEKDGLFCERIFGPERDWECACGKYKGIKHKGIKCDRCGVEITHSRVRRKRMGHITLAAPVAHIWFFKALPSRLGALLAKKTSSLERVIYFQDYIVTDPGDTGLAEKELLTEDKYREARDRYGDAFEAGMGAEAIEQILAGLDLDLLIDQIYHELRETRSRQKTKDLIKRLKITKAIRDSGNAPSWLSMRIVPVIPPDLRPLVLLESGNFATSDLNDLYRRLINRNNRLKKLLDLNAPEVIIRNEKRMLQQSVDALFDNNRCRRPVMGSNNRPLKSLTDMIKGKQGRFRENLLGKRVDYSARSVIVVGPELKLHQCGLPKKIALELFQPFIIRRLKELGHAETIKIARKMLERKDEEVWDILEEVIHEHPVLLNRAPTLHRMGIQAFEPILIEGNAIKLHPLVCTGFNADFDGDQMAVHLPLSFEAQVEATTLMLSTNNVFSPANGQPIIAPSQDIVLGCYYMTCGNSQELGEDLERPYDSFQEVEMAWRQKKVTLQTRIKVRLPQRTRVMEIKEGDRVFLGAKESKIIQTTVGRCIFHDIIPKGMPFYNYPLKKGRLMEIIADSHKYVGRKATLELLDDLKDTGFKHSTLAGLSFATYDLHIPKRKIDIINDTQNKVGQIQRQYEKGVITDLERYNQIIDEWTHATERVGEEMIVGLKNDERDGKPFLNPVYLMAISGARGSHQQIRQLAGMRGLMAKPSGKIIETPIKANFREGLHVLEYFSSTHGARKGLADTALKTADSGYLTRKLADIGQNVVINEKDCGTERGISKGAVFAGEMVEVPFWRSIRGRTARDTIVDVVTDEVIVSENELITEDIARKIEKTLSKKGKIRVRSALTCDTPIGICATCYGMDLSRGRIVEEGLAVGIIAAQSIGEPGTQLTMRTFHIGGVAHAKRQESDVFAGITGKIMYENMHVAQVHGEQIEIEGKGTIHVCDDRGITLESYEVPLGSIIHVKEDDAVKAGSGKKKGSLLFQWDPHMEPILALKGGTTAYEGIIEGVTMRREKDAKTQVEYQVIIEHKGDHHPMIVVNDEEGQTISSYPIPEGAHLEVDPGDVIVPGQLLAKTPREVGGTQDITGGLPRVTEIFEVRKPRTPAVMAEIDGQVEIGPKKRGKGTILIRSEGGQLIEHTFQHGRKLHVHTGDRVKAGDALTKGNMIPHDILRICGAEALQQYLLQEVQKVYRSQNVTIDDKHIEIVIMQMIRKVQVADTGDTEFLPGQIIDKFQFRSHNKSIAARGGKPATAEPLLLGITKASLFSESFISAASFQETTKVLTEAALSGKEDRLLGLKENVILGHLVPAGTGFKGYHSCVVEKFASDPGQDPLGDSMPMSLGGGKLD